MESGTRSAEPLNFEEEEGGDYNTPIPVAIEHCIVNPILLQYKQVSKEIVRVFLDDLELERHLRALRRYFFAEDGLWARGLARGVYSQDSFVYGSVLQSLQHILKEVRSSSVTPPLSCSSRSLIVVPPSSLFSLLSVVFPSQLSHTARAFVLTRMSRRWLRVVWTQTRFHADFRCTNNCRTTSTCSHFSISRMRS